MPRDLFENRISNDATWDPGEPDYDDRDSEEALTVPHDPSQPQDAGVFDMEQAKSMGFSPEEIDFLIASNILPKPLGWEPSTPEDLEWIAGLQDQIDLQMEDRERQHQRKMRKLQDQRDALNRWDEKAAEILYDALPKHSDKSKYKGLPKQKYWDGDLRRLSYVKLNPAPELVDRDELFKWAAMLKELPSKIRSAIRLTQTSQFFGWDALSRCPEACDVLLKPLKEYVTSLPPEQIIATEGPNKGEVLERPAVIPGVKWSEPKATWRAEKREEEK